MGNKSPVVMSRWPGAWTVEQLQSFVRSIHSTSSIFETRALVTSSGYLLPTISNASCVCEIKNAGNIDII